VQVLPQRTILEQYKQLVYSLESLLELARHQRSLSTIILTRHLGDLLAPLIQVLYQQTLRIKIVFVCRKAVLRFRDVIPDPNFFIPDPHQRIVSILTQKIVSKLSEI
jgi:hypothetical protein